MHEHASLLDTTGTSWTPVILLDISLRGIGFATPEVMMTGTIRQLRFKVPGSPMLHHALVYIVHQSSAGVPSGFKVGAKFEEIGANTTNAIVDFLSKPQET